jgi:hypothetical protein
VRGFEGDAFPATWQLSVPAVPEKLTSWRIDVSTGSATSCTRVWSRPAVVRASMARMLEFFG